MHFDTRGGGSRRMDENRKRPELAVYECRRQARAAPLDRGAGESRTGVNPPHTGVDESALPIEPNRLKQRPSVCFHLIPIVPKPYTHTYAPIPESLVTQI